MTDENVAIQLTKQWVTEVIINHQLCPFAREAMTRTGFYCSSIHSLEMTIGKVLAELTKTSAKVDNILLVIADGADAFEDFWAICMALEGNLEAADLLEHVQLAHFHPQYRFDGVHLDDRSNWTNRSPFPTLHFLSADAVERAVETHPDPASIPDRNIEYLQSMSATEFDLTFRDRRK